jgi:hypothetical protein
LERAMVWYLQRWHEDVVAAGENLRLVAIILHLQTWVKQLHLETQIIHQKMLKYLLCSNVFFISA